MASEKAGGIQKQRGMAVSRKVGRMVVGRVEVRRP